MVFDFAFQGQAFVGREGRTMHGASFGFFRRGEKIRLKSTPDSAILFIYPPSGFTGTYFMHRWLSANHLSIGLHRDVRSVFYVYTCVGIYIYISGTAYGSRTRAPAL